MTVFDLPLTSLDGKRLDADALRGRAALIVNVASRCGLTPQYGELQRLYERYRQQGLVVLGTPCNQFGSQEPGDASEIGDCAASYEVSFPLTEKLDVNGHDRHPLYELLTAVPDASGLAGDVQWNFEKFLVSPRGRPLARFRPTTPPDAPEVLAAIEAQLPGRPAPVWQRTAVGEIRPDDRVRTASGVELTVSRLELAFLGRDDLVCLVEDGPERWLAQPLAVDDEVEILA
jgi:glutathione peroxidase